MCKVNKNGWKGSAILYTSDWSFYLEYLWMKLSIVIPTRWDQNMKNTMECLLGQTFTDFEVIFVLDKTIADYELWISDSGLKNMDTRFCFITNLNSLLRSKRDANDPRIGGNASELRNYGIKAAKGEFILLMDDDEQFDVQYLEQNFALWEKYKHIIFQDFVLCPTLMYRKTGNVQNYGFSYFNYWMSRPVPASMGDKEWISVQMYSGNSLFAPAYIFQQHLFDERLDFVLEDLDFSRGLSYAWYPILVSRDLKIYHMEWDKTILQQARVGNEYAAYRKAKHRRIFVQKYGSWFDKIKFYLLGFWWQPLWLAIKILIYGKGREKWRSIRGLCRGSLEK